MAGSPARDRWALQEAEAGFAELVRRARQEGPQRVTVQGHDEIVVLSAEEFRRLGGGRAEASAPDDAALRDRAARQAALLRGAPEEAEALRFIEDVASWPER